MPMLSTIGGGSARGFGSNLYSADTASGFFFHTETSTSSNLTAFNVPSEVPTNNRAFIWITFENNAASGTYTPPSGWDLVIPFQPLPGGSGVVGSPTCSGALLSKRNVTASESVTISNARGSTNLGGASCAGVVLDGRYLLGSNFLFDGPSAGSFDIVTGNSAGVVATLGGTTLSSQTATYSRDTGEALVWLMGVDAGSNAPPTITPDSDFTSSEAYAGSVNGRAAAAGIISADTTGANVDITWHQADTNSSYYGIIFKAVESRLVRLDTITGTTSQNAWVNYSYGSSDGLPYSLAGRLLIQHIAPSTFTSDQQIDDVTVDGTLYDFESDNEGFTYAVENQYYSAKNYADRATSYSAESWVSVATLTTNAVWNRDAGGTGSANTGSDVDHTLGNGAGFYLYFESSGSGWPFGAILRSPSFTLDSSPSIDFWSSRFGAAMGNTEVWWYDES